jgi:hypothetical protein
VQATAKEKVAPGTEWPCSLYVDDRANSAQGNNLKRYSTLVGGQFWLPPEKDAGKSKHYINGSGPNVERQRNRQIFHDVLDAGKPD